MKESKSEIKILWGDEKSYMQIRSIQNVTSKIPEYVYLHINKTEGTGVGIIAYRKGKYQTEFLLVEEVRPNWNNAIANKINGKIYASLTGGVDRSEGVKSAACRELFEEGGYKVTPEMLVDLGVSFASKYSDTVLYLYAIDVTTLKSTKLPTNVSAFEKLSKPVWVQESDIRLCLDPLVYIMYVRLKKYLEKE